MKFKSNQTVLFAFLAVLAVELLSTNPATAAQSSSPFFNDLSMPSEVQAAHDSFLQGDFNKMVVQIKNALMAYPGDVGIQQNLLELYDKAYELKGDYAMSPDWSAPTGVSWMSLTSNKTYVLKSGDIRYRMGGSLELPKGIELEQYQLIRYPNEVLLDKQAGLGEFETYDVAGSHGIWMTTDFRSQKNSEGLYLLNLKLKGQPMTQGWFILSHMNADGSPTVRTPSLDQDLSTGTPTFTWDDFVSGEYRNFEKRRTMVSVSRRAEGTKEDSWQTNRNEVFTNATVGGNATDIGLKSLPPDEYTFRVTYREQYHFGDLTMVRGSTTSVPFSIK